MRKLGETWGSKIVIALAVRGMAPRMGRWDELVLTCRNRWTMDELKGVFGEEFLTAYLKVNKVCASFFCCESVLIDMGH